MWNGSLLRASIGAAPDAKLERTDDWTRDQFRSTTLSDGRRLTSETERGLQCPICVNLVARALGHVVRAAVNGFTEHGSTHSRLA